MPHRPKTSTPRLFTVEEANRTLPLVGAIVSDLAPLWETVRGMRKRIQHLVDNRHIQEGDPYSDELAAMQETVARNSDQVEGFIEELRQLGVEFKGPRGHVGFPGMLDGRLVYLSWLTGEPEVSHWMDLDGDFSERQSLFADTVGNGPGVIGT